MKTTTRTLLARRTGDASRRFTLLALLLLCTVCLQAASTIQFATTSYTVPEGCGAVILAVQRWNDTNTVVSVDYATTNGTAIAGLKYTATAGTLTFAAGETNKNIAVPILNEGFVEGPKKFGVALSNPMGGAVLGSPTNATVNIIDNDAGVEFQSASYSVAEDAGVVLIGVMRGDDGTLPVTVDFATTDQSAINGVDYVGTTNTLSFAPQEKLKVVPIPIVNRLLKQPNRTFLVTLRNPNGASLGSTTATTVTILDNDLGCRFESATYSVGEDAGAALIGVLRGTDDTNSVFTVTCATADGSATSGLDYAGLTNMLSFAPGETVKRVAVPIFNQRLQQASRNFRLALTNPTGGSALGALKTTTVSILYNIPGVGFDLSRYSVWEGAGEITLPVVRGNDWTLGPITVDYATADVTATAGQQYQAVSGTLRFEAGETVKSLTIPLLGGIVAGSSKSFQVTLSNLTGVATLGTAVTTVDIQANVFTVAAPADSGLTIRRDGGVTSLTWAGGGQLQRADRVTGPWQTLATAKSPWIVQPQIPATFYQLGAPRPAPVYVPSSYDGQTPRPLVILLHGYGGAGADIDSYFQLRPLAETRDFLYSYPDGTIDGTGNRFWNTTDACCDFSHTGTDDAGYLRSLIEEIGRRFRVDPKRVYVIGHSNGGFMAYRMACQSADLIAGIAALAGETFLYPVMCVPSQPVNILHIQGTLDSNVAYTGGQFSGLAAFPGALQTIQIWADFNHATGLIIDPAPSLDLTTDVPGLDSVVGRYTNAPPGGAVELWTIVGGSHVPHLSTSFSPDVIDWLLSHPKP